MMSKDKPADFKKRFDIVGCFVEHDGNLLLLRRHLHKANGGKWGLPAGKMDISDGNTKQAVLREVAEETGLKLTEASVIYFDSLYVRDGTFDIEWHMFSTQLDALPEIKISPEEHQEYRWVSPSEALELDLIHDLPESIKLYYKN